MFERQFVKLTGANMDIDLTSTSDQIGWKQEQCPWNQEESGNDHQCAIKNIKICPYFCGIEYLDTVLCSYPHEYPYRQESTVTPKTEITGPKFRQSQVCEPIIKALPEWFGITASVNQYLKDIDVMPTFLARIESEAIGFLTLHEHNSYASEIHVMGVIPGFQRLGIGSELVRVAQDYLRKHRTEYLQVKTLGPTHPDKYYAQTRAFYFSMGFRPLEELTTLWGEANPCLLMVKSL